jgi:hypothetical protein
MDCTLKLLQITLEPKFTCSRTKAEAIILNVFEPHVLHCDLEKVTCISVLTDACNHDEIMIFPVFVRHFDYETGVNIKIFEPDETSVIVII